MLFTTYSRESIMNVGVSEDRAKVLKSYRKQVICSAGGSEVGNLNSKRLVLLSHHV